MDRDDRITLGIFIGFLAEFEAHSPEATIRHLMTFLTVALEPGMRVTDLAKRTSCTVASSSRHVRGMAVHAATGKALLALGFLDGRTKAVMLTDNGARLVAMLTRRLAYVPAAKNADGVHP
jgi:hypothetical protein